MNRNRILNPYSNYTYISVPLVKAPQKTPINHIVIDNQTNWRGKIIAQLEVYKRAPYYDDTVNLVKNIISYSGNSLAELNIASVVETCKHIGLDINWEIFSDMDLHIPDKCAPDEWALEIAKALSFDCYINAPGGQAFFNREKYKNAGVQLQFIQPKIVPYIQRIGRFVPELSIIDVLMFNGESGTKNLLEEYTLLPSSLINDTVSRI